MNPRVLPSCADLGWAFAFALVLAPAAQPSLAVLVVLACSCLVFWALADALERDREADVKTRRDRGET